MGGTGIDVSPDMNPEDALAHYGVKGMKWGVRRDPSTGVRPVAQTLNDSAFGKASQRNVDRYNARKSESRKDYKERVKREENEFYQQKLDRILSSAVKSGDNVLIQTRYAGDTVRTITTGKEFVAELTRGRAFDAKVTEVFANKTKQGPYQLTGDRTQYVKSERGKR